MYQFSYADALDDSAEQQREQERLALQKSIDLMERARDCGARSREAVEALLFVRRLWAILIEDLGDAQNGLPDTLRADLISIGLWIMRESEEIRQGNSDSFDDLIIVSGLVLDGIR